MGESETHIRLTRVCSGSPAGPNFQTLSVRGVRTRVKKMTFSRKGFQRLLSTLPYPERPLLRVCCCPLFPPSGMGAFSSIRSKSLENILLKHMRNREKWTLVRGCVGSPDGRKKSSYFTLYTFLNRHPTDAFISGNQAIVSEIEKSGNRGKNII